MKKTMTWAEWKQLLCSRNMLVPMIAILFIPVLYAGMFLWAFWNPYANMDDMPVAIVDLDKGAVMDGEQLALGQELADKLIDSKQFDFQRVEKADAEKGLKNQDYYVVIEIPENFSEHATTLLDDEPEKLTIIYKPNEGFNFLSGQIGETAMDRIRAEVNGKVASTYAEKLFDSIVELGDGFGEAADGAGELHDAATKLADGADELKGYLETLAGSTITLADGSDKVAQGASDAATGAAELNKGLGALSQGSQKLLAGAEKALAGAGGLEEGLTNYTAGVGELAVSYGQLGQKEQEFNTSVGTLNEKSQQLHGAADQLTGATATVATGIEELSQLLDPVLEGLPAEQQKAIGEALSQLKQGSTQLTGGMQELSTGTTLLTGGTANLIDTASQLAGAHREALAGLGKLNGSSPQLLEGANALATGNGDLASGIAQVAEGVTAAQQGSSDLASGLALLIEGTAGLKEGTDTLASKSQDLAEGSVTLANGLVELDGGTLTLQEKLAEANETTSEVSPTDKTYGMVGTPVEVEKKGINLVPNYGTGFAPYFLSMGLFIGALLLSIVFPLVEPAMKPTGAFRWFTSKVSVLAIVGLLQALIAVGVVKFALGMEIIDTPLFVLTAIITSYTFIAIVQICVSILGDAGRFVAIIMLILQLTTSAGTFPLELIPAPLQFFNTLLPMTYSVQAFKGAISTGDFAAIWMNNGILIGFMVVCLVATFGYFELLYKKRYSRETVEA